VPLSSQSGLYFENFDTESAFSFYEAVRKRLPDANFPVYSKFKSGLLELVDFIDVFVFDAFGVLNVGNQAIAGAQECIATLRAKGKQVFVLTNAATFPKPQSVLKFQNLGFDFANDEIITSRMAAENAISTMNLSYWGVMSNADFSPQDLGVNCILLEDDPLTYNEVDGFLFLSTWEWNSYRQLILEKAISKKRRPIVVANPDVIAPLEERFSTEPGYVAHRIADLTNVESQFHGKPFPSVFRLVENRLEQGFDPKRICMIGDTLHTDVLGGASRGWSTVLVADHGLFRGNDPLKYIQRCGIVPDWIVPSI
jgi:HAD superfamily hydrolase (TIGR01450 family)